MRTFVITAFILIASFTLPITAFACYTNSDCGSGNTCVGAYVDVDNSVPGTCQPSGGGLDGSGVGGLDGAGNPGTTLINPLRGSGNLNSFLSGILTFVINIGTVVVILMIVFVGFKFVTAQGNETKITEAKRMLLWTIIGALILLGARAIQLGITATVNAISVGS